MAQSSQQLLLDLFPSKKTQHRGAKNQVMYQTGSTTTKMKALSMNERVTNSHEGKSITTKLKTLSKNQRDAGNPLDKYPKDTYNHIEPAHLGSNWANSGISYQKGMITPIASKMSFEPTTLPIQHKSYDTTIPQTEMQKSTRDENKSICRTTDEAFLSYRAILSKREQQREMFSYLGLGRRIDGNQEEIIDKPCLTTNAHLLTKFFNKNRKEMKPIPKEKYLAVDITSAMGKKIRRLGILDDRSTVDLNSLTSGCPKRVSSRSTTNADEFLVTFKRPKEKRDIKPGVKTRSQGLKSEIVKNSKSVK